LCRPDTSASADIQSTWKMPSEPAELCILPALRCPSGSPDFSPDVSHLPENTVCEAPCCPARSSVHQNRMEGLFPRKSPFVQRIHKRIRIKLLDIVHSRFIPCSCHQHHRSDHRRNTCGIGHCLRAYFLIAFLMVADIIEIICLVLSVLLALEDAADIRLAHRARPQRRRVRKNCL